MSRALDLLMGAKKPDAPAKPQEMARGADDAAVRQARETGAACQQQVDRVRAQLAAARERLDTLKAGALEAERRGEDVMGALADAGRQEAQRAGLLALAERGERDARAAVERAMEDARHRLAAEYVGRITALLSEQEEVLWRIRDQQTAIDRLAQLAFAEGIPIGIGTSRYFSIGFPGAPFLRADEEILTWIRHRSIAARWAVERGQ